MTPRPQITLTSFKSDPSFLEGDRATPCFIYVTQTDQSEDNKSTNPPAKLIGGVRCMIGEEM
jgi:hypothetical protein